MPQSNTFLEIATILSIATLFGMLGQKLRQPLLIMFMAAGIIIGPSFLGIIESYSQIDLLAHMGIALLLFIVGLKLDLSLIKTTGPVALATGMGQIIFTSAIGFAIALAFGMDYVSSAYVAVALTFSSTIIIVKLLSDKKEIDSLHGQIAIGFLIVQDIAAILALVALTTFGSPIKDGSSSVVAISLLIIAKGAGFLLVIGLIMKFVIPWLTRRLAYSQELLTLFAIAWAVLLGAAGEYLGFSKEVGAFLAGISLASSGYRESINARLTTLRDFLLLFFFIDLGARLDLSSVGSLVTESVVFSLFVLIGNPLIVLIIMGLMGYRRRTGFLAGLTVAQISEFSLIVASLGLTIGHINKETMGLITLVGVVTIFASTYMILYSGELYGLFSKSLRIFERKNPYREASIDFLDSKPAIDVILVGLGNYGSGLADYLLWKSKNIIGVDFDPTALEKWRSKGISVLYGDMSDPEIHEQLPLESAKWVVSTVRSKDLNLSLLKHLQKRGYTGKVALTASNQREVTIFEKSGAHLVFRPFTDAAEQAADSLSNAMDILPENINFPISFREVRIRPSSAVSGKAIKDIPLRSVTGVSILAISRAGFIYYEPDPDFDIQAGDHMVIMGSADRLRQAETILNQFQESDDTDGSVRFDIAEVKVSEGSSISGKTLADIGFRQKYGVTIVGIRRGGTQIATPMSSEKIKTGDCLILIGSIPNIETVKRAGTL